MFSFHYQIFSYFFKKFRTKIFIIFQNQYKYLDRHPCNDVTFGGCENEYVKSKILSKKSLQTVQSCNAECYDTFNCTNYRYNNQTKECTLLTNEKGEYRDSCNIRAGPVVRSFRSILFQLCIDSYKK